MTDQPTITDQAIAAFHQGRHNGLTAGQHDPDELIRAGLAAAAPHIAAQALRHAAETVGRHWETFGETIDTTEKRLRERGVDDETCRHRRRISLAYQRGLLSAYSDVDELANAAEELAAGPGSVPATRTEQPEVARTLDDARCGVCGLPSTRHSALRREYWPDLTDAEQDAVVAHERATRTEPADPWDVLATSFAADATMPTAPTAPCRHCGRTSHGFACEPSDGDR